MGHEISHSISSVRDLRAPLSFREVGISTLEEAREVYPNLAVPFNSPKILQTFAEGYGGELIILHSDNSDITSPLIAKRKFRMLGSANYLPPRYIGLIGKPNLLPHGMLAQSDGLVPRGLIKSRASFTPAVEIDTKSLEGKSGVEVYKNETCVLPLKRLTPEGLVEGGTNARMKEKVRSARRNIIIGDAREEDIKKTLPRLVKAAYERTGSVTSLPPKLAEALWERHYNDPLVHMIAARNKLGETVGVLVALTDQTRAYSQWYSRIYDDTHKNVAILEAMIAEMSIRAQNLGLIEYDLGGGTKGIKQFKVSMGAMIAPYTQVDMVHPLGQAVDSVREKARLLKGRLHG